MALTLALRWAIMGIVLALFLVVALAATRELRVSLHDEPRGPQTVIGAGVLIGAIAVGCATIAAGLLFALPE